MRRLIKTAAKMLQGIDQAVRYPVIPMFSSHGFQPCHRLTPLLLV